MSFKLNFGSDAIQAEAARDIADDAPGAAAESTPSFSQRFKPTTSNPLTAAKSASFPISGVAKLNFGASATLPTSGAGADADATAKASAAPSSQPPAASFKPSKLSFSFSQAVEPDTGAHGSPEVQKATSDGGKQAASQQQPIGTNNHSKATTSRMSQQDGPATNTLLLGPKTMAAPAPVGMRPPAALTKPVTAPAPAPAPAPSPAPATQPDASAPENRRAPVSTLPSPPPVTAPAAAGPKSSMIPRVIDTLPAAKPWGGMRPSAFAAARSISAGGLSLSQGSGMTRPLAPSKLLNGSTSVVANALSKAALQLGGAGRMNATAPVLVEPSQQQTLQPAALPTSPEEDADVDGPILPATNENEMLDAVTGADGEGSEDEAPAPAPAPAAATNGVTLLPAPAPPTDDGAYAAALAEVRNVDLEAEALAGKLSQLVTRVAKEESELAAAWVAMARHAGLAQLHEQIEATLADARALLEEGIPM